MNTIDGEGFKAGYGSARVFYTRRVRVLAR